MSGEKEIAVFFSWQSDLPKGLTTSAIRKAMRGAASELEDGQDLRFKLQEATSNTPGSPYIPGEIERKIRLCDIFVADITTVVTRFLKMKVLTPLEPIRMRRPGTSVSACSIWPVLGAFRALILASVSPTVPTI